MAKYTVTHSCGHTEEVQLFGKETERSRKLDYFRQYGQCSACYKAEKAAKEAAQAEANAAVVAESGAELPALKGSDKQVAWATKIRLAQLAKVAKAVEARLVALRANPALGDKLAEAEAEARQVVQALGHQTSASWWIDRRDLNDADLLRLAVAEAKARAQA